MKCTGILVLLLGVCLLPAAQAQQSTGIPRIGKRGIPHHGTLNAIPDSTSTARSALATSGSTAPETIKFSDQIAAMRGSTKVLHQHQISGHFINL